MYINMFIFLLLFFLLILSFIAYLYTYIHLYLMYSFSGQPCVNIHTYNTCMFDIDDNQ